MRAALIALMLMFGSQAGAECGNLCDRDWWITATEVDVQAELDGGADAKVKNEKGKTPWDLAQENEKLKGTKGYWALNDAQYN